MAPLKILGIHGLGDHRNSPWKEEWKSAILAQLPADQVLEFSACEYDDIFAGVELSLGEQLRAFGKLLASGVGGIFRGARGGLVQDARHGLRWTAGYVVAWLEDEEFRKETRARLLALLEDRQPDVLLAHSLGSLISYDALSHADGQEPGVREALAKLHFVSLGSQIGNPFVIGNLTPGRIAPLAVRRWTHLYNPEDDVFTAPIRLPEATNYLQVETRFDDAGFADHAATSYFSHAATRAFLWTPLSIGTGVRALGDAETPRAAARERAPKAKPKTKAKAARPPAPARRALLVGINEYPDPAARLEGCVNDVFLMSAVLQECGFHAEEIRVCLNERATASGIVERLEWLLRDPQPGDELVFYYSGHGAQLPTYGDSGGVDRKDETLVPHDFDWSPETSITDDRIFELYAQLPYETRLAMIFDCCHSGGIHRAGGPRARGLNPPDDIRHRDLRWNVEKEMWEERSLNPIQRNFAPDAATSTAYFGEDGAVSRLGRASALRRMSRGEYEKQKEAADGEPVGPYLPLLIEACAEKELAFEYRHGVTSYGAFTYTLATLLRRGEQPTFAKLVELVGAQLAEQGYRQRPQILGPRALLAKAVPWRLARAAATKPKTTKPKATRKRARPSAK
jgi:hypothetical protein